MAVILQTPSILPIIPFDPSNSYNIEFIYSDNQSVKNRAVITDNETGSIVYDSTQSSMRLFHILPANTLTAGKQYLAQIQVYDIDNNSSNLSDPVLFLCLTTPIFNFTNLVNGTVFKQANITLNLEYSQSEGEQLKNYQFIQYNTSKIQIDSSEVMYNKDTPTYTFYGLENNSTYYLRAIGETQNGISLDTGYIEVNVILTVAPVNVAVQLENDYSNGVIRVSLNIKDVQYILTGNKDYTFENGVVVLNSTSLTYNDGFSLKSNDDFSMFCQVAKVTAGTFLNMENGLIQLTILKICDSYYCALTIQGSNFAQYVKLENALVADDGLLLMDSTKDYVTFIIRRRSGLYGLEIE